MFGDIGLECMKVWFHDDELLWPLLQVIEPRRP
jgi:hypothetical protein